MKGASSDNALLSTLWIQARLDSINTTTPHIIHKNQEKKYKGMMLGSGLLSRGPGFSCPMWFRLAQIGDGEMILTVVHFPYTLISYLSSSSETRGSRGAIEVVVFEPVSLFCTINFEHSAPFPTWLDVIPNTHHNDTSSRLSSTCSHSLFTTTDAEPSAGLARTAAL
jgi:hypothetical protein